MVVPIGNNTFLYLPVSQTVHVPCFKQFGNLTASQAAGRLVPFAALFRQGRMFSFQCSIKKLAQSTREVAVLFQELGKGALEWAQELEEANRKDGEGTTDLSRTNETQPISQTPLMYNLVRAPTLDDIQGNSQIKSARNKVRNEKFIPQKPCNQDCTSYTPHSISRTDSHSRLRFRKRNFSDSNLFTGNRISKWRKKSIKNAVSRRDWNASELEIIYSTIIKHRTFRENALIEKMVDALGHVMSHGQVRERFRKLLVSGIVRAVDTGVVENGSNIRSNNELEGSSWVLKSRITGNSKRRLFMNWDEDEEKTVLHVIHKNQGLQKVELTMQVVVELQGKRSKLEVNRKITQFLEKGIIHETIPDRCIVLPTCLPKQTKNL